jgi:hypothetical protein
MGLIVVAQPATRARQIAVAININDLFRIFLPPLTPDQLFHLAVFLCLAPGPSRPLSFSILIVTFRLPVEIYTIVELGVNTVSMGNGRGEATITFT